MCVDYQFLEDTGDLILVSRDTRSVESEKTQRLSLDRDRVETSNGTNKEVDQRKRIIL